MTNTTTPATAPAATAPVAAAPVAAAPVAAAPVAAPVAAAPAVLPQGFGPAGGAPKIGTLNGGTGGGFGIPDENFNKPLLIRIVGVELRTGKFEEAEVEAPTVDYIVLDPATGNLSEVRGAVMMQKFIRKDLVAAARRGDAAVVAVATTVPPKNGGTFHAKVLRDLDDSNSGGYGAEVAKSHLIKAATETFGWWPAA